jgi:DNA polymerase family A
MPSLHWDVETRSAANLNKVGARRYAADPTTTVLCIAYAVDDAEPTIWTPGMPVPAEFIEAATNEAWRIIAHNDAFEREIEAQILHPRYGWPQIPLARRLCSMALCRANGLPGSLKEAAALLGLVNQKDQLGHAVILELSDASKPLDPAKLELLHPYCAQDVRTERELFTRFPPLPPEEQKVWALDQTINARGFAVDLALAQAARKIAAAEKDDLNARITTLTRGVITTANQNGRILKYVRERGHTPKNLSKRNVAQMLAHDPDAETREILELRRAGGRSSVAKFRAVIADADADSRVRDTFRYHGTHTGRWAGRSFQPQNLPKTKCEDVGAATDAVRSGSQEQVRLLNGGDTLAIVSNVVRNVIVAKRGHVLIGADFSAIESRVLAWLSDEPWKLDTYHEFDRTGDPRLEPYCVIASRMLRREVTPEDEAGRQHGKTADLALGFGGSVMAWRKFMPDDPRSDEQIKRESVDTFRDAHPATRKFWKGVEALFKICVRHRQPRTFGRTTAEMADGALRLTLPSGRCLVYREARLGPGKFEDSVDLHFHNGYQVAQAWFGTIVENIVQGIARDLLACSMLRLESAGFPVVLHCHDEAVAEVPEGEVDEVRFRELMTTLPPWAEGLPIAAKVWINRRYGKPKSAPNVAGTLDAEPHEITHQRASHAVEPHVDHHAEPQQLTQADIDEINAGLKREGIELLNINITPEKPDTQNGHTEPKATEAREADGEEATENAADAAANDTDAHRDSASGCYRLDRIRSHQGRIARTRRSCAKMETRCT